MNTSSASAPSSATKSIEQIFQSNTGERFQISETDYHLVCVETNTFYSICEVGKGNLNQLFTLCHKKYTKWGYPVFKQEGNKILFPDFGASQKPPKEDITKIPTLQVGQTIQVAQTAHILTCYKEGFCEVIKGEVKPLIVAAQKLQAGSLRVADEFIERSGNKRVVITWL